MDFECPEYQYVYAWAGERGFPVLLHTWGQEVLRFHKLAQKMCIRDSLKIEYVFCQEDEGVETKIWNM